MGMLSKIVGVAVGLLVCAVLLPSGLGLINGSIATLTAGGVNASVITVFTILMPILAIISVALYFMPRFGGRGED